MPCGLACRCVLGGAGLLPLLPGWLGRDYLAEVRFGFFGGLPVDSL